MDNKKRIYNENPLFKANFLSKLLFCWFTPLMQLGQKKPLEEEDLYKPSSDDETECLTNKLEKEWKKEVNKVNPSLAKAIVRVWLGKTVIATLLLMIEESIRVIQPIMIRNLIRYFNGQIDFKSAMLYGTIIAINGAVISLVNNPFFTIISRQGMQMKISVCGLIYRKALTLNYANSSTDLNGKIINLLSNDASRIEQMLFFASYLIIGPLQAISIVMLLFEMVDKSILSGLLVLVLIIPLQSLLGKVLNSYRLKTSKVADARIDLIYEILNGIKIVKMYCWEVPFKRMIEALRKKELKSQSILFVISSINNSIDLDLPNIITYVSVVMFINITNKPLLPGYVVFIIAYYIRLCGTIGFGFVKGFTLLIAGCVSCKRVQKLLLQPEVNKSVLDKQESKGVFASDLSASWNHAQTTNKVLKNISFEVKEGKLLAIVGSIGSGKSSLLMALLGELPSVNGCVKMSKNVFYVSQEPWVFSSTIKQNITFGKLYSKEKFKKIIEICALKDDLKMFSNGENTLIGDKGVNLSGGQRARINLARALYHDPDVYLFDDPLSAVDASVAKDLFDNCINGYLKSKTRILVTHQVHHLANANEIIILDAGNIKARGRYEELRENNEINFSDLLNNLEQSKSNKTELTSEKSERKKSSSEPETTYVSSITRIVSSQILSLTQNDSEDDAEFCETRSKGAFGWNVYKIFFNFGIGVIIPILVLVLFVVARSMATFSDYWLSNWATEEEMHHMHHEHLIKEFTDICKTQNGTNLTEYCQTQPLSSNTHNPYFNRNKNFVIYSIFVATSIFTVFLRSSAFFATSLLAAKMLHRNMFNCVMQAKMRFFDMNPVGRIINRFSKDVGNMDDALPLTLFDFLQCLSIILNAVVVALVINYWIIIPLIPLSILLVYMRRYFLVVSRELKRIESLCRSPIYIHTSNTLAGIVTIRASNSEHLLLNEYNVHSNYHTQAYFSYICANRWFAIRLDSIVSIYSAIFVFGCIFAKDYLGLSPGQVGLALVYGFQIVIFFQWLIVQSAEVENLMTSVERVQEYSVIKGERCLEDDHSKTNTNWPYEGKIEFENVSFTYDDSLPYVLRNLTFTINAKEKVGIIGRTGAGKSSIFSVLYRIAEPSGKLLIDGVDITKVSLQGLRRGISIIPQEPTLFSGTVRYNLDPLSENNDKTLWKTLEIVQLKETVKEMNEGLDAHIQKNGSNLSVGQKQLFCLARAILRKSKILLIDEATANVDFKTDALVQKAIRECFTNCTVITIAHRLETIMDSDRIMCLSNGELVNYGPPSELAQDENSVLYKLLHCSESNQ